MELITTLSGSRTEEESLAGVIKSLPQLPSDTSFGEDIDQANEILLSDDVDEDAKRDAFFKWAGRSQPCIFGRLASRGSKGLGIDMCWIHEWEIDRGRDYVAAKIQEARRAWKDRAERGESSGFLIMFNSRQLTYAQPSQELVDLCVDVSNLYLVEHAPIEPDVIYTEAVPLRREDGQLTVFKAGCNIFYTGAHRTVNHDRRIPGGLMFSMNSPGHYANSLVLRGVIDDLSEATDYVRETAFRSIGNGGIGQEGMPTASWHNRAEDESVREGCPVKPRPAYVPDDFDPTRYSAVYHTDVLVPTAVTSDERLVKESYEEVDAEVWGHLILDYITTETYPSGHVNYGLFHGHPIEDCAKYHNPWPARVAHNDELFKY